MLGSIICVLYNQLYVQKNLNAVEVIIFKRKFITITILFLYNNAIVRVELNFCT
jgi:hypothetical protein